VPAAAVMAIDGRRSCKFKRIVLHCGNRRAAVLRDRGMRAAELIAHCKRPL